jgi:hypothetical protein
MLKVAEVQWFQISKERFIWRKTIGRPIEGMLTSKPTGSNFNGFYSYHRPE